MIKKRSDYKFICILMLIIYIIFIKSNSVDDIIKMLSVVKAKEPMDALLVNLPLFLFYVIGVFVSGEILKKYTEINVLEYIRNNNRFQTFIKYVAINYIIVILYILLNCLFLFGGFNGISFLIFLNLIISITTLNFIQSYVSFFNKNKLELFLLIAIILSVILRNQSIVVCNDLQSSLNVLKNIKINILIQLIFMCLLCKKYKNQDII